MKLIIQALQKLFNRIFRGSKKPSPKVRPQKIQSNQSVKQQGQQQVGKQEPGRESFWQDKLKSDTTDEKRDFYRKYRHRLENQNHDITPKQ